MSEDEKQHLLSNLKQFRYEGVAHHASQVAASGYTPLYRFYVAAQGIHVYTTSAREAASVRANLPGYRDEGVGYFVPVGPQEPAPAGLLWRGVNLAGAEFGTQFPGTFGIDYIYPNVSSVDYFKNKGMNTVRLPFAWERLQPSLNQAFDSAELDRLTGFVDSVTATGITVVLDPHNYARHNKQVIGSDAVPHSAFANLWTRLATQFKNNPRVVFGLMNEPRDMPTEQWLQAANAALAAIRATGATNVVSVPGNGYTGAFTWNNNWYGTPNGTVMKNVVDPGDNMVFEVHQYFDADASGTTPNCESPTIGAERLADFTHWLRANGKRGYLGEVAGANNATCNQAVASALQHLQNNSDVWVGWTWWAAGPWWGNYLFSLEPNGAEQAPQMQVLAPYLR